MANVNIRKKRSKDGFVVIDFRGLDIKTCYTTSTKKSNVARTVVRNIQNRAAIVETDGTHDFHRWTRKQKKDFLFTGLIPVLDQKSPIGLSVAIESYLSHKRNQRKADSTVSQYERELDKAKQFFKDRALSTFSAASLQEFADWLANRLNEHGRNRGHEPLPVTIDKHLKALKRVFKRHRGLGEPNIKLEIFDPVSLPVETEKRTSHLTEWVDIEKRREELSRYGIPDDDENAYAKVIYTKDQLDDQLRHLEQNLYVDGSLKSTRLYVAVLFACATGCRRSELTRVRRCDLLLDSDPPTATITKMKGRDKKPFLRQKMALPNSILPPLNRLCRLMPADQESLFCANDEHWNGQEWIQAEIRGKADYLTQQIKDALANTKWEHAAGWHIYRHTLASKLLIAGYSQTEVKELVGWCTDEMAQRYQHLTHTRKAQIINSVF